MGHGKDNQTELNNFLFGKSSVQRRINSENLSVWLRDLVVVLLVQFWTIGSANIGQDL